MLLSNYQQLLIVVCLAALSVGIALGTPVAACAHRVLLKRFTRASARERARLLLGLRLAPTVAGIVAASAVLLTFVRHEPAETTEAAGVVLLILATLALILMTAALLRVIQAARRTYRCHRLLARCGQRMDLPGFPLPAWRIVASFPVAAVSGVLRPRLILSSCILDDCTADELAMVVRHEEAHARHRDNLCRACLLALPDPFALFRRGAGITRDWQQAVEEAADDEAVRSDPEARIALAGALVRVGRMATSPPPAWMPALALYDGDNLESRVRRLLTPASPLTGRNRLASVAIGLGAVAVAGWTATGSRPLHDLMEWAVRHLP